MATDQSTLQSGIYQIRCTANGKVYIGSAVEFRSRWANHRSHLVRGIHHSPALQNAWLKYGAHSFEWEILEIVPVSELVAAEQGWLDKIKPFSPRGYNICMKAYSCLGIKRTPEMKAKISALHKGRKRDPKDVARRAAERRGKKHTPETREKMAVANKNRKRTTEEIDRLVTANKNRKWTAESRAKVAAQWTPERRAKHVEMCNGRECTPEIRAKISDSRKKSFTPEQRAHLVAINTGKKYSEESRAKMSASRTGQKRTPEQKERMRLAALRRWKLKKQCDDTKESL